MDNNHLERSMAQKLRFRHLELISIIYERGSIVKAAQRLNLTQPAVTKALQNIEAILEITLFERTNRGLKPTFCGEIISRHANIILSQLHHAAEELEDFRAGYTGHVVVGTLIAAAARLLPEAILLLKAKRPGVAVTVVDGTYDLLLPALKVGDVDVVLGRLPDAGREPDLNYETFYLEPTCLVVRSGHPIAHKKNLKLRDLIDEQWLVPVRETSLRHEIENAFAAAKTPLPTNIIESMSILTNKALLQKSDCISVMPYHVISDDIKNNLLSIVCVDLKAPTGPVGAVTRSHRSLAPASTVFLDCVRSVGRTLSLQYAAQHTMSDLYQESTSAIN